MAEELGVRIFSADIIYHLFDQFTAYMDQIREERRRAASSEAVFPCILKILPQYVFMTRNPILLGVDVVDGIVKIGTPLCVLKEGEEGVRAHSSLVPMAPTCSRASPSLLLRARVSMCTCLRLRLRLRLRLLQKQVISLGRVSSLEHNNRSVEVAKRGDSVAVKIEAGHGESHVMYGRQFDEHDLLYSKVRAARQRRRRHRARNVLVRTAADLPRVHRLAEGQLHGRPDQGGLGDRHQAQEDV
ncbi:MAG: hypothetical protein ACK40L_19330, partial [Hydrogenophaga sp.]